MIRVTDQAARHLQALLTEKGVRPEDGGLRLQVEKGGCAGLQYAMKVDSAKPGDEIVRHGDVMFIVDAASQPYLNGCEIDYLDTLSDSGFRIHNPNAVRSCGCGTSFEPATPAPQSAGAAEPEPEPCGSGANS